MSVIRAAAALLFVSITNVAAAQQHSSTNASALLGRWDGLPTTTVGIGHVMEFTSNGVAMCTPGSLVEGTYRLNGPTLIQTSSAPPETVTVRIDFRRDTMLQVSADRLDSAKMIRRSGTAAASAVGEWRSKSSSGRESFLDYRADGTFKLWVPFDTEHGTYRIAGDTLIIAIEKGKLNGRYLWAMDGNSLKLTPIGPGKQTAFVLNRRINQ